MLVGLSAAFLTLIQAFTDEKLIFLYKEELRLSASDVGTLKILVGIPLYLQPFLGAWSELFALFGYHRRSYYVLGSVLGAIGFLGLSFVHQYHYATVACLVLVTVAGGTILAVIVNATMVVIGNKTGTFGILQSLLISVPLLLRLAYTSHLSGYVTQHWSYQHCFQIAAFVFALYAPLALLIDERKSSGVLPAVADFNRTPPQTTQHSEREQTAKLLRQAAATPGLWVLISFLFYMTLTPAPFTARTYFITDVLHLDKQFIGDLGTFSAAGQMAALVVFVGSYRFLPVWALVWGAWLMNCLFYPVQMCLHDATSAKAVMFFADLFGYLYQLCLNMLAARACLPRIEGTIYGLVMAAIALGITLCDKLGGALYDYFGPLNKAHHYTIAQGWMWCLCIGLAFAVFGAVFIPFLPAWAKSTCNQAEHFDS